MAAQFKDIMSGYSKVTKARGDYNKSKSPTVDAERARMKEDKSQFELMLKQISKISLNQDALSSDSSSSDDSIDAGTKRQSLEDQLDSELHQFKVYSEFNKQLVLRNLKHLSKRQINKFITMNEDLRYVVAHLIKSLENKIFSGNHKVQELYELSELEVIQRLDIRLFNEYYQRQQAKLKETFLINSIGVGTKVLKFTAVLRGRTSLKGASAGMKSINTERRSSIVAKLNTIAKVLDQNKDEHLIED